MTPGIHTIDEATYHADPCPDPSLSSSLICRLIDDSPFHAFWAHPRLTPDPTEETSVVMDTGVIAHGLLLEGIDKAEVLDFDNYRTAASRQARDEARQNGRVPILKDKWAEVHAMVVAARERLDEHKEARSMFTKGKPEQTLIWQEGLVWCRARLDWLHDSFRFIDDYKTSGATANPTPITRNKMFTDGWDIQAAWYLRGLKAITGVDATFRFAVQEQKRPFALSVISPGPAVLMLAEKKINYAVSKFAECLQSGQWPSYPDRICYADLPERIENEWIKREENEGVSI